MAARSGDFFFGRARRLGAPFLEVFAEGFRRLAGGELLSGCPERSQRGTRGWAQMGASRPYSPAPWTPITGDALLAVSASFPARKI